MAKMHRGEEIQTGGKNSHTGRAMILLSAVVLITEEISFFSTPNHVILVEKQQMKQVVSTAVSPPVMQDL